jgi:hypothetical protein
MSEEDMTYIPHSYFVERCRRAVRKVPELVRNIESVLEFYQSNTYHVPGNPEKGIPDRDIALVTDRTWTVWERLKEKHVEKGCLQDPEGVDLYIEKPCRATGTGMSCTLYLLLGQHECTEESHAC